MEEETERTEIRKEESFLPDDETLEMPEFLRSVDLERFKPKWGTLTKGFKLPRYSLAYMGTPFAPLGGIHAITGQSGHGKTMTFSVIMAAILSGEYGGLSWNLPDIEPTVLYIDTEMEEGNTMMVIGRVHTMCGLSLNRDYEFLKWLNLREVEKAEDRWAYTVAAIEELKPTVTFLDGNLDLINDFNDNKQCQEHIRRCMSVASHYNCSVWCLVHENPGSTKIVGHLGSMLERKVTDVFAAKKKKDKSSVTPIFEVEARKTRYRDILAMSFIVEQDMTGLGIPTFLEPKGKSSNSGDGEEVEGMPTCLSVEEAMTIALGGDVSSRSTRDLRGFLQKTLGISVARVNKEYILPAMERGIVERQRSRDNNGYLYSLVNNDEKIFTNFDESHL